MAAETSSQVCPGCGSRRGLTHCAPTPEMIPFGPVGESGKPHLVRRTPMGPKFMPDGPNTARSRARAKANNLRNITL